MKVLFQLVKERSVVIWRTEKEVQPRRPDLKIEIGSSRRGRCRVEGSTLETQMHGAGQESGATCSVVKWITDNGDPILRNGCSVKGLIQRGLFEHREIFR